MAHRRIDIHAHPSLDLAAVMSNGGSPGQFLIDALSKWNIQAAISRLDHLEIDVQVISLPILPVSSRDSKVSGTEIARKANELLADVVAKRPDRFAAFATVPADESEGAAEVLAHAVDVLGLDGLGLASSSHGKYLGDALFEPVLAEAARRQLPVFVHPAASGDFIRCSPGEAPYLAEFPFETARAVIHAIFSGVFRRYPDLRLILAHCGGALPALAWRIEHLAAMAQQPGDNVLTAEEIRSVFRRLYYETALAGNRDLLAMTLAMTDVTHVLYGTDSGAVADDVIMQNRAGLTNSFLPDADIAAVMAGNAQRLIPRLAL